MEDREQLELLCSRHFDGDLSETEKTRLDKALESDAALRDLYADLERSHDAVNLLVKEWALPAGFAVAVSESLSDAPDNVIQMPRNRWSAYAAVAAAVIVIGLVGLTAWLFQPQEEVPVRIADAPVRPVAPTPRTHLLAYSDGEISVKSVGGVARLAKIVRSDISLPATITAPRENHAVIRLGHGTAVLAPGASARISDDDLDGVLDLEPVEGDIYIEAKQRIRARVARIVIEISHGGMTLRQVDGKYFAEPSHGRVVIGDGEVICDRGLLELRRAMISDLGRVTFEEYETGDLTNWAVAGRADEIKRELKRALGAGFDRIPAEFWGQWDEMIAGLATRPRKRATNAYMLRFMIKNGLFVEVTPVEREALLNIADILAEGTTAADVPEKIVSGLEMFLKMRERDPEMFETMMRRMKERFEKLGRRMHKRRPDPVPEDSPPKDD